LTMVLEVVGVKKVGIIGCGAIGSLIAEAVEKGIVECDELILYDCDMEKAERLQESLGTASIVVANLDEMLKLRPAVIVEAASHQAAREYIGTIVDNNIELIVMSVGALLDSKLKSSRIHTPSGAIGGLDAISSARLAGIDDVILTTRKNPKTLNIDNQQEKLVYEGSAQEAVRRFPREMNVAATLALMVPPERLLVRVISDPKTSRNTHEIAVKWAHGDMFLKFANDPHPDNPKTSALAAWSAIKLLKDLLEKRV
jgi:aspartate dehydrogenase